MNSSNPSRDDGVSEDPEDEIAPLIEHFLERVSSGRPTSIDEFADEHPEHADELRALLPIASLLEEDQRTSEFGPSVRPSLQPGESPMLSIGPGTQMGDYVLEQMLGHGGMGVVYQARHNVLGNLVAIKVLPAAMNRTKNRERFLREASAAAKLNHPNIVRVYDFGSHQDTLYFVMSLVDGSTLQQLLGDLSAEADSATPANVAPAFTLDETIEEEASSEKPAGHQIERSQPGNHQPRAAKAKSLSSSTGSRGQLSLWRWTAEIGVQAADALAYAHASGVIHRDIKPSNLILSANETLFVSDFGLAKVVTDSDLTGTGELLGTLRFLPPESFEGKGDHRVDIYGLGLSLYETACGQRAFGQTDRGKLIYDITSGHITPLRKLVPKIPTDLDRIISKAIANDPASRFATAEEMRDDLQRFLAGEPVSARPASVGYRASRWISRNKAVTVLASAVILLLLAATAITTRAAARLDHQAQTEKGLRVQTERLLQRAEKESELRTTTTVKSLMSEVHSRISSQRPGQRVGALDSLREAIKLSEGRQELRDTVASQYSTDWSLLVRRLASAAFVLHDVPAVKRWHHPHTNGEPSCFSQDLTRYAMVKSDDEGHRLAIWDTQGEITRSIDLPKGAFVDWILWDEGSDNVAFRLTGVPATRLQIWDLSTDTLIDCELRPKVGQRAFASQSFDGELLAAGTDDRIYRLDLHSGEILGDLGDPIVGVGQIEVSPDRRKALVRRDDATGLVIIDLESHERQEIENDRPFMSAAWSPSGDRIVLFDRNLFTYEIETGHRVEIVRNFGKEVHGISFSHDGTLVWAQSGDLSTHVFQSTLPRKWMQIEAAIHPVAKHGNRHVFTHADGFEIRELISPTGMKLFGTVGGLYHSVALLDQPDRLVHADSQGIHVFDLQTNRQLATRSVESFWVLLLEKIGEQAILFSSLNTIYRLDKNSSVFDEAAFEEEESVPGQYCFDIGEGFITGLAMSPNQDQLAVVGREPFRLLVYDFPSYKKRFERELDFNSIRVRYSSDGQELLVSTFGKGPCRIFDSDQGTLKGQFGNEIANFFARPSDSNYFVYANGRLRIVNRETYNSIPVQSTSTSNLQLNEFPDLIHSSDRVVAIMGSVSPRGVVFVDTETLKPTRWLLGDAQEPDSIPWGISEDGKTLVTQRGANAIAVWDLETLDDAVNQFIESSQ